VSTASSVCGWRRLEKRLKIAPRRVAHAAAFYVLEGEYRIFIEGAVHRCPAGSFILIPSGLRHGFRVGDKPSRKLNLYARPR
jgi:quercetin dioxygenase-like cupin family protein